MDWWLYVRTENPVPPLQLALEQDFGRKGEQKARAAWPRKKSSAEAMLMVDQPPMTRESIPNGIPFCPLSQKSFNGKTRKAPHSNGVGSLRCSI